MPNKLDQLSWEGKIGRRDFFIEYIKKILSLIFIGGCAYLTASWLLALILWTWYCFLSIKIIFLIIKRLRDLQKSGHWTWYLFVPGFNLYVIYLLFLKKGA